MSRNFNWYQLDDYNGRRTSESTMEANVVHIIAVLVSNLLLFCLIFGYSVSVNVSKMRLQAENHRALGLGILCQFVIFPFLGLGTAILFNLSSPSAISLLIITSSPSGSFSSWWCSILNADLSFSLTMTAFSSMAAVFLLPLNVFIYTSTAYTDVESNTGNSIIQSLNHSALFVTVTIVTAGIGSGMYCAKKLASSHYNPHFRKIANHGGNIAGLVLLIFSVLVATFRNDRKGYDDLLEEDPVQIYFSAGLPCLLSLAIVNMCCTTLTRLNPPERIALSVECTFRNTGIASAAAVTMFSGKDLKEAALLPLYYGIVEAVVIGVYMVWAWKTGWTKAPPNENFFVVITTCYEFRGLEGETDIESDQDAESKASEDGEDWMNVEEANSEHDENEEVPIEVERTGELAEDVETG